MDVKTAILEDAEVARLAAVAKFSGFQPCGFAVALMPYCGLKPSELCDLTLDDGDAKDGTVTISVGEKTTKPRKVLLLKEGTGVLGEYLALRKLLPGGDSRWLFPTESGHIDKRNVETHLKRVVSTLGMSKITAQDLKRWYTSTLIKRGVNEKDVCAMVGHSRPHELRRYLAQGEPECLSKT